MSTVMMLSSAMPAGATARCAELGVASYLTKPVGFEALLEMVKSVNLYWLILNEQPEIGRA